MSELRQVIEKHLPGGYPLALWSTFLECACEKEWWSAEDAAEAAAMYDAHLDHLAEAIEAAGWKKEKP